VGLALFNGPYPLKPQRVSSSCANWGRSGILSPLALPTGPAPARAGAGHCASPLDCLSASEVTPPPPSPFPGGSGVRGPWVLVPATPSPGAARAARPVPAMYFAGSGARAPDFWVGHPRLPGVVTGGPDFGARGTHRGGLFVRSSPPTYWAPPPLCLLVLFGPGGGSGRRLMNFVGALPPP